ncbi:unnamed protein product [Haemonchus placei]|uniref:GRAS domain-containing protein n=1 Tax=Haemonchus placei TaxID=6290 RepID=A0A0N4WAZ6_HAEPC|nr:unnamed protein product [Haemonchus placei]
MHSMLSYSLLPHCSRSSLQASTLFGHSKLDAFVWDDALIPHEAAAAMTYGVGVAQNNADIGGGGGMNDEEYDENSSARLFERSRIKALAEECVPGVTTSQIHKVHRCECFVDLRISLWRYVSFRIDVASDVVGGGRDDRPQPDAFMQGFEENVMC